MLSFQIFTTSMHFSMAQHIKLWSYICNKIHYGNKRTVRQSDCMIKYQFHFCLKLHSQSKKLWITLIILGFLTFNMQKNLCQTSFASWLSWVMNYRHACFTISIPFEKQYWREAKTSSETRIDNIWQSSFSILH